MTLFIGLSLLAWIYLLWLGNQGRKNTVPLGIRGGGGGESTSTSHTYYYYKIKFPHNNIDSSQSIIFYDANAALLYTLPPNYEFMNYGQGILSVPGTEQNEQVESVTTATYYVFYSKDDLVIDYNEVEIKIKKTLVRSQPETLVQATFEYVSIITPLRDIASVIDGRWDTQVQTEFFSEPPEGYNYAIVDLGATYTIQALDIVAGFYKPDDVRRFDIDFTFDIQYSTDGDSYSNIGDNTRNIKLAGGESKSFEERELGVDFQARYLKLILNDVKNIPYKTDDGIWAVAITEIAAYNDIILKSDAQLIPATYLTRDIATGAVAIPVSDTSEFDSSGTAYIQKTNGTFDSFTYTGKTATSFTGVSGLSQPHLTAVMLVEAEEEDDTVYDYNGLLPKLKDRIYKVNKVSDNTLYTQSELDYVSKKYLTEFVKNHNKISVDVLYAPYLEVGQTLSVTDTYNDISENYFIAAIIDRNGFYNITLERYPAT